MNDTLISAITDFTLSARELLTREAGEQLEGIYGWLPDGAFGEAKHYPALAALSEAAETRRRLEQYAREEIEAGVTAPIAREKLKREAAFTWLNRAAAFRLLEERKLIKPTLARLHKSNGYVFWLTTDGNEAVLKLHEQGSLPLNLMGEGPADVAYRQWLCSQCAAQSTQVSVLFDPGTLATRFCPRPVALRQLVESMNVEALAPAWQSGNEETVGWLYEGFIQDENADVFEKFSKGKKVLASEIGAATQRFTPRWIVQFLIQNSLGRLWLEMHPDSALARTLPYLVPFVGAAPRSLKPVKEITFLDPSCGSMHFGLVAFDLYAMMYREEREKAGQPGWLTHSSVNSEDEIPGAILEHNLHGIDIDLRAVQVSALALFLRAKILNREATATDANLACANIEQLTGGQLDEFIKQTKFSHPIYERILRRLGSRLRESDHLGSLLRIENDIEQLVSTERKQSASILSELPGLHPEQFATEAGVEEFYSILTDQIGQHLDYFVQSSRGTAKDGSLFARETAKGLRFLRLVERRYDVVATNPPYMSGRNMSDIMCRYLAEAYDSSKSDLYAAFISRSVELAAPTGFVAMITQQSFMFLSSYEDMRGNLREETYVTSLAHLGARAFPKIVGEKVNTAAFVLRRGRDLKKREDHIGTYFRLVKERDALAKQISFEAALDALRMGVPNAQIFSYKESDFDAIPGKPWVYWISAKIRSIFQNSPRLDSKSNAVTGINTGDNFRFRRFWWECSNIDNNRWTPFVSGGQYRKWFGNLDYIVSSDFAQIALLHGSALRSREYWQKEGLTFCLISTTGFNARYLPPGYVFSSGGNCWFSDQLSHLAILGYLNSTLAAYLLLLLNPTINYTVGSISALPLADFERDDLKQLAGKKVGAFQLLDAGNETTTTFLNPLSPLQDSDKFAADLLDQKQIDAVIYEIFAVSPSERALIEDDLKIISTEDGGIFAPNAETLDFDPTVIAKGWLSYAVGTVLGRFAIGQSGGFGCGNFSNDQVVAIRALMDHDGVMPCEKGHAQDLAARAAACLALMLGEASTRDTILVATGETGDPADALRTWLEHFTGSPGKSFWKYHHQLYCKRPIYWPLQSPEKHFTVWVFHELLGKETLFTVKKLADEQLNLLNRRAADLRPAAATQRAKAKELDQMLEQVDDLTEFIARLETIIQRGYTPCIDDGVLLNAAPLHPLLPSWPEAKKAWQELEAEKYEWAHQAMLHWPSRVKAACKTNKSFAIAHGLA